MFDFTIFLHHTLSEIHGLLTLTLTICSLTHSVMCMAWGTEEEKRKKEIEEKKKRGVGLQRE
jgi:hypothetical protein